MYTIGVYRSGVSYDLRISWFVYLRNTGNVNVGGQGFVRSFALVSRVQIVITRNI